MSKAGSVGQLGTRRAPKDSRVPYLSSVVCVTTRKTTNTVGWMLHKVASTRAAGNLSISC